eukprot:NODE_3617_length_945_cov_44.252232_g3322_i0.p1 GENE.NODE_3617_length_945_cov_44.252232_g3322_i0~~NODE_3617_length_945_cov_44.252232_g3322_i0.p1  ORF type:complete len:262 (-),score=36.54 NODE_3617_length_945_cov_44.252232_g3322_i0:89-874(-)
MSSTCDFLFKVLLLGDCGVGKSTLIHRYVNRNFDPDIERTIGVDFQFKTVHSEGKVIKLQLWDPTGQPSHVQSITSYAQGADAIVLCFDPTSSESFKNLKFWKNLAHQYGKDSCYKVVARLKSDIGAGNAVVSDQSLREFANTWLLPWYPVSSVTGEGVEPLFANILQNVKAFAAEPNRVGSSGSSRRPPPPIIPLPFIDRDSGRSAPAQRVAAPALLSRTLCFCCPCLRVERQEGRHSAASQGPPLLERMEDGTVPTDET